MRALERSLLVLTLLALCLTALPLAPSSATGPDQTVFVRLPAAAYDAAPASTGRAIDYGSFVWAEVSAEQLRALDASGLPFQVADTSIGIYGRTFDPLKGLPDLPAELSAPSDPAEPGLHLVQFVAPVRDAWLADLRAAGLTPLQYYAHNAYLVWGTAAQADRATDSALVRWSGPFLPAFKLNPTLAEFQGRIENVAITFYNSAWQKPGDESAIKSTLTSLTELGGQVIQAYPAQPDGAFYTAIVSLDARLLADVAQQATTWALDYASPEPGLDDEIGNQIVAGNHSMGVPFPDYQAWLAAKGVDGSGIIIADVDTGMDTNNSATAHLGIRGRIAAFVDYTGGSVPTDEDGHGTHTGGTIAGNGALGITDPGGFLYGQGVAPAADLVVQNALWGSWPPAGGWQVLSRDSVLNGAVASSNSWYTGASGAQGYSAAARTHDLMVRDANFDTPAVAEPLIMVFSAGNSGPGSSTLTEPKEAKNLISIGASENYRPDNPLGPGCGASADIDGVVGFSSRGPCLDGRLGPVIVAPGSDVASLRSYTGSYSGCGQIVSGQPDYVYMSGTSMACPHVAGGVALIADWWAQEGRGTPSPAMTKALLVNGAVDMGTPDIPNNNEGWGRMNLDDVIHSGKFSLYFDQETLFTDTGQSWSQIFFAADPAQPVKITLVWSDAPGAVGASPALVNDLDLIIENDGNTYLGNDFAAGWSTTGGSPDALNNLENVYLQTTNDAIEITVSAANIAGDGVPYNGDDTDQDFALVCSNCVAQADYYLDAEPRTLSVCAPDVATSTIEVGQVLGYAQDVSLQVLGVPPGVTADVTPALVTPPGQAELSLDVGAGAVAGEYTIVVSGTAETTNIHTTKVDLHVCSGLPTMPALQSPADGATDVPPRDVTLAWDALPQIDDYSLRLGTEPSLSAPLVDETGIALSSYTLPSSLDLATCYFWQVKGTNTCGEGDWANPFHFATVALGVVFEDDMESGPGQWSHQADQGADNWALVEDYSHSPTHAWFVPDESQITDSYLWNTTPVSLSGNSMLTFWHRHQFEGTQWDGSVLEISADGGPWTDLGPQITANGYNGVLSTSYGNPLGGRDAWVGDLTTWTQVEVDLSTFAGSDVQIRWRIGCDSSVFDVGWYIDDVQIVTPLPPSAAPMLSSIDPNYTPPGSPVPVIIEGESFMPTSAVMLGDAWPLDVTYVSSRTLDAIVPANVTPGTYDLTVINGDCQTDTFENAYTVGCLGDPEANFTSDSPIELGLPMQFTSTVTGAPPINYTWDFGDGIGTSNEANPDYTYTTQGEFTVTLGIVDVCGSTEISDTVEVSCFAPVANLESDSPVRLGRAMHFTATVDGTGPLAFTWDFGGPGTGTGLSTPTPVYTYTAFGDYQTSVEVTGACGLTSATADVTVLDPRTWYYMPLIFKGPESP